MEKMDEKKVVSKDFPFIPETTDLIIQVEDTVFHVNKGILMVASPVFSKMLSDDFKEREEGIVTLPDKSAEEIDLLLKCIHPNFHVELTDDIVDLILPLTLEYMMPSLIKRLDSFLCQNHFLMVYKDRPNLDLLMKFVYYGDQYGTSRIQEHAVEALVDFDFSFVEKHKLYSDVTDVTKLKIALAKVKDQTTKLKKMNVFKDKVKRAVTDISGAYNTFSSIDLKCTSCKYVGQWRAIDRLASTCPQCQTSTKMMTAYYPIDDAIKGVIRLKNEV